jgi:hypothetical protein
MAVPSGTWLDALRAACEKSSQSAVARQLKVSVAMVNQALKGTYKGDLGRLQAKVEGILQTQTVACPVLDNLPKHRCLEYQDRDEKRIFGNPLFMQFYRACRSGCPHSKLPKEY